MSAARPHLAREEILQNVLIRPTLFPRTRCQDPYIPIRRGAFSRRLPSARIAISCAGRTSATRSPLRYARADLFSRSPGPSDATRPRKQAARQPVCHRHVCPCMIRPTTSQSRKTNASHCCATAKSFNLATVGSSPKRFPSRKRSSRQGELKLPTPASARADLLCFGSLKSSELSNLATPRLASRAGIGQHMARDFHPEAMGTRSACTAPLPTREKALRLFIVSAFFVRGLRAQTPPCHLSVRSVALAIIPPDIVHA
ncbi:hypothetical protein FB451DRAFT_1392810 [Mycena latifolia]|nr:hypothetical protein FB451DRAFT_1392810 [Mycena latifolia]